MAFSCRLEIQDTPVHKGRAQPEESKVAKYRNIESGFMEMFWQRADPSYISSACKKYVVFKNVLLSQKEVKLYVDGENHSFNA